MDQKGENIMNVINVVNKCTKALSEELVARYRRIHPSELGHVLEFGFVSPDITAVNPVTPYTVGRAITCRISPTDSASVYQAMSMAEPGDFLVIDMQGEKRHACLGEIATTFAQKNGIVGVLVDGPVVDSAKIIELGLPVFARGKTNLTTKLVGYRGEINVPVTVGGVSIAPGDLVLANEDGVTVVPYDRAQDLIEYAEKFDAMDLLNQKAVEEGTLFELWNMENFFKKLAEV